MTEIASQLDLVRGADPVREVALANAVDLTRSNEPIEADTAPAVAAATLEIARLFEGYLRGEDPP